MDAISVVQGKGRNWKKLAMKERAKSPLEFKKNRLGNNKNAVKNLANRQVGKNQQKPKWVAEEQHIEASSRTDLGQSQKPPL